MQKKISLLIISILLIACQSTTTNTKKLLEKGQKQIQQKQVEAAVVTYYEAINLLKTSSNDSLIALANNRLGEILFKKNINKNARIHFKIAYQHALHLKDKTLLSFAYRGLGKTYFFRKSDSAYVFFNKAYNLKKFVSDQEEISSIYNNLANWAYCIKDYNTALCYNSKALSLTTLQDKIDRNYALRGQLFAHVSQLDSALFYIYKASKSSNIRTQASSYIKLTELPSNAGLNDSLRFAYVQKAQNLVDSIEKIDDVIRIVEISNKAEQKKESVSIEWTLILFFILIIVLFIGYMLKLKYQKKAVEENIHISQHNNTIIHGIQEKLITSIQDFTSTNQYQHIREVLSQKESQFSFKELDELQKETLLHFKPYIKLLNQIVTLSDKDAFLCCLFALKLSIKECSTCRNVSPETIRSQKARIKKRIPQEWINLGINDILF